MVTVPDTFSLHTYGVRPFRKQKRRMFTVIFQVRIHTVYSVQGNYVRPFQPQFLSDVVQSHSDNMPQVMFDVRVSRSPHIGFTLLIYGFHGAFSIAGGV